MPAFGEIFRNYRLQYYWTVHQSEWATDVMFKSPEALASVFPQLARGSISSFCSHDVMRFLGGKTLNGTVPVGVAHVGSIIVPIIGAVGLVGKSFISIFAETVDVQPDSFVTVYA